MVAGIGFEWLRVGWDVALGRGQCWGQEWAGCEVMLLWVFSWG